MVILIACNHLADGREVRKTKEGSVRRKISELFKIGGRYAHSMFIESSGSCM